MDARFWPSSNPDRIKAAISSYWDRDGYEKHYGTHAMMAMDACRSAARFNDQKALLECTRRLNKALAKVRGVYGS